VVFSEAGQLTTPGGQAVTVCMEVLYTVDVVYLVSWPPCSVMGLEGGVGAAVWAIEYSAMVCVVRKVAFCEAGQSSTVGGQAVALKTAAVWSVDGMGLFEEELVLELERSSVLVGKAMATGALLVEAVRSFCGKLEVFWNTGEEDVAVGRFELKVVFK